MFPQLYKSELENEFNDFMDWLHTFPVYKGKANYDDEDEDEDERIMGKYKVIFSQTHSGQVKIFIEIACQCTVEIGCLTNPSM